MEENRERWRCSRCQEVEEFKDNEQRFDVKIQDKREAGKKADDRNDRNFEDKNKCWSKDVRLLPLPC